MSEILSIQLDENSWQRQYAEADVEIDYIFMVQEALRSGQVSEESLPKFLELYSLCKDGANGVLACVFEDKMTEKIDEVIMWAREFGPTLAFIFHLYRGDIYDILPKYFNEITAVVKELTSQDKVGYLDDFISPQALDLLGDRIPRLLERNCELASVVIRHCLQEWQVGDLEECWQYYERLVNLTCLSPEALNNLRCPRYSYAKDYQANIFLLLYNCEVEQRANLLDVLSLNPAFYQQEVDFALEILALDPDEAPQILDSFRDKMYLASRCAKTMLRALTYIPSIRRAAFVSEVLGYEVVSFPDLLLRRVMRWGGISWAVCRANDGSLLQLSKAQVESIDKFLALGGIDSERLINNLPKRWWQTVGRDVVELYREAAGDIIRDFGSDLKRVGATSPKSVLDLDPVSQQNLTDLHVVNFPRYAKSDFIILDQGYQRIKDPSQAAKTNLINATTPARAGMPIVLIQVSRSDHNGAFSDMIAKKDGLDNLAHVVTSEAPDATEFFAVLSRLSMVHATPSSPAFLDALVVHGHANPTLLNMSFKFNLTAGEMDDIASWGQFLKAGATVVVAGCNTGTREEGEDSLADKIHRLIPHVNVVGTRSVSRLLNLRWCAKKGLVPEFAEGSQPVVLKAFTRRSDTNLDEWV